MKIRITKPDGDIYQGDARFLLLPGVDGLFEILNSHAPIIAALSAGTIRLVEENNEEHRFDILGGVVKGEHNDILILVQ